MNKLNRWLLPWGFQTAGWILLALSLLFPVFIMLTWRAVDYNQVFDEFPYDAVRTLLYLATGLIVFSKERVEDEYLGTIRTSSLIISAYVAGLWFIFINLLSGAVPAVSEACRTLMETFPDMPPETGAFLGKAGIGAPRLAYMSIWPGAPLFAFWIYIVIYKIRLFAAWRRLRNEK